MDLHHVLQDREPRRDVDRDDVPSQPELAVLVRPAPPDGTVPEQDQREVEPDGRRRRPGREARDAREDVRVVGGAVA